MTNTFALPPPPEGFTPTADAWLDGYIRHFSASSLRQLKMCPEQYRQRQILGRKERPAERFVLGTAVHKAVVFSHEQKITSHEDLPVPVVVEYFHDEAWPKAVERDGGESEISWETKPDEARRDGERVASAYHKSVSPRVQPLKVEQPFWYSIDGVPVPFYGFIDVEEEHNNVDLKTGKQVQRKPDGNWYFQGAIYTAYNGKPTHFHSLSRAKTPSIATPLEHPEMALNVVEAQRFHVETVLRDFAAQVEWYFHRFGPDNPWPTTGVYMDYKGGPMCRYCGFRKFCVAWEHERIVTA